MRDSLRLVHALRVANADQLQVRMAATILSCNGIEAALDYVAGAIAPIEAATQLYLEDMEEAAP